MFSTYAIRSRSQRTLREARGILWANLPPASNLPDAEAVKSLRALVRTPQVHQALERGNDAALCFVLRAVNRIVSDEDQPNTTISRLWKVLAEPELNRALGQNSRMILGQKNRPLDDLVDFHMQRFESRRPG